MADIMTILQWAIPSGGIGAAISWIANRKAATAKTAKAVHDTYHAMYDDVSALLLDTQKKYEENTKIMESLQQENSRTRRAINRLSRAIEAIELCPHRNDCPVRNELSLDADDPADTDPSDAGTVGHRQTGKKSGQRKKSHQLATAGGDVDAAREG